MGNCQAIDAATLVIQHPSGKVEKMYWSVSASEIMKLNPGHYVALLITTTICHTTAPKTDPKSPSKTSSSNNNNKDNNSNKKDNSNSPKSSSNIQKNNSNSRSSKNNSKGTDSKSSSTSTSTSTGTGSGTGDDRNTVRITRVKLLRPTDTLALGHVYRLISTQEVMKGLVAKKQAKLKKNGIELADSEGLKEAEILAKRSQQQEKSHQVSRHGHRSRTTSAANGVATAKSKTWQPSLHSISEAAS